MKKIIIAAALIFTTGIVMSYSKADNVKPTPALAQNSGLEFKKDLGSGD